MCVYQAHTTPRPLGINRLWSDSPVVNGRRKERERENDVRQKSIGRTRVSFPGMIFAFQTFLFYLVLSVFWTISKKFVWEAGSQSYKLWIMNQKTPKRFRWKKFFFFFSFKKKYFSMFFCHGKHGAWPANLTEGAYAGCCGHGDKTASSNFPCPSESSLICPLEEPQVAWGTCGSFWGCKLERPGARRLNVHPWRNAR